MHVLDYVNFFRRCIPSAANLYLMQRGLRVSPGSQKTQSDRKLSAFTNPPETVYLLRNHEISPGIFINGCNFESFPSIWRPCDSCTVIDRGCSRKDNNPPPFCVWHRRLLTTTAAEDERSDDAVATSDKDLQKWNVWPFYFPFCYRRFTTVWGGTPRKRIDGQTTV